MIQDYMAETVTWRRWTGVNAANEPTFTDSSIRARVEYKRRMTTNAQGQLVLSETQVFTASAVGPKDRITIDATEWPVKSTAIQRDLDGNALWYEVRL